jgi:hypothetical protein
MHNEILPLHQMFISYKEKTVTWNNRIYKHIIGGKEYFALHETFYNKKTGQIESWTEKPLTELSDSIDELIQDLEQKLTDAKRFRNAVLLPNVSVEENNIIADNK